MPKTRLIAVLMALAMLCAVTSGCGGSAEVAQAPSPAAVEPPAQTDADAPEPVPAEAPQADAPEPVPAEAPEADAPEPPEESNSKVVYELPLSDGSKTFTMWCENAPPFFASFLGESGDYNGTLAASYVSELTGVNIVYECVGAVAKTEQFNLLIASGDYPDMINGLDGMYSGGASAAYSEGIILNMEEYVLGNMPAYRSLLDDYSLTADAVTDAGEYLSIYGISTVSQVTRGPTLRSDWLEDFGMETPLTYDALYDYGKACVSEKGCAAAFYFSSTINPGVTFSSGFDLPGFDITASGSSFYLKNGEISCAYVQEEYREYLKTVAKWYADGLISPDFYSLLGMDGQGRFTSGEYAMYWDNADFITENNALGTLLCKGIPITRREAGQTLHFYNTGAGLGTSISIMNSCADLQLLSTFLDFLYTEPGIMLVNYGMEGKSYELDENGEPQWLEETYTSEEFSFQQMTVPYILAMFPSLTDSTVTQSATMKGAALEALAMWNDDNCDGTYNLPSSLSLSEDEQSAYTGAIGDVETHANSYMLECITGASDVDATWDEYVAELYSLGLDRCLAARQSAYERYLGRTA